LTSLKLHLPNTTVFPAADGKGLFELFPSAVGNLPKGLGPVVRLDPNVEIPLTPPKIDFIGEDVCCGAGKGELTD
jgi:hypothetical protein